MSYNFNYAVDSSALAWLLNYQVFLRHIQIKLFNMNINANIEQVLGQVGDDSFMVDLIHNFIVIKYYFVIISETFD